MDASSPDVTSPLNYQLYGNGKIAADLPSKGSENQLLERQVQLLHIVDLYVFNRYLHLHHAFVLRYALSSTLLF